MEFPLITARLQLRPITTADARSMHAIYSDPDVMRWVGTGPVSSQADTDALLESYANHQCEHGFSFWAVQEQASNAIIGDAGLYVSDDGIELGYTLARDYWGLGYATEAARACIRVAAAELRLGELVALTRPENAASVRVLMKLGFATDGYVEAYRARHIRYRLPIKQMRPKAVQTVRRSP